MKKHINLESFQREMDVMLVKATLTIVDRRSGAIENREFVRFGQRFPIEQVGKELAQYGYDVLGFTDADFAEGTLDLVEMYDTLSMAEVTA